MKKWRAILVIAICLTAYSIVQVLPVKTQTHTIVVPDDYATIQEAVANAASGDTVLVRKGTYSGGVLVNKPLTPKGEDPNTTIISGGATMAEMTSSSIQASAAESKYASAVSRIKNANFSLTNFMPPPTFGVYINSSDVVISSFTIGGATNAVNGNGDRLQIVNNNLGTSYISGSYNVVANNTQPFFLSISGSFNTITGNVGSINLACSNSTINGNLINGLTMENSKFNRIANNSVTANEAMRLTRNCSYNFFVNNVVEDAGLWGILMGDGVYNVFYGNIVRNTGGLGHDGYGLALGGYSYIAEKNLFLKNSFINNDKNFGGNWPVNGSNSFDDGKQGNYWHDYKTKYPNAVEVDNSGTGNTPYVLTNGNVDNHPLLIAPSTSEKLPVFPEPWNSLMHSQLSNQLPSPIYLSVPRTGYPDTSTVKPTPSPTPTMPEPTVPEFSIEPPALILACAVTTVIALAVYKKKLQS